MHKLDRKKTTSLKVIGNRADKPHKKKMRTITYSTTLIFLLIVTSSCNHQLYFGTYEFKSVNAEWWRINIKLDSTFFLEDYTAHRFDSIRTIGTMSGTWKMKGSRLFLNEPYDPEHDSIYDYNNFFLNKWKYRNGKIYAKGPEFSKLHFTRIK